jgi:hypothetical protein
MSNETNVTLLLEQITGSESPTGTILGSIALGLTSVGFVGIAYRYFLQWKAKATETTVFPAGAPKEAFITSPDVEEVKINLDPATSEAHIATLMENTKNVATIAISKNDLPEIKKMLEIMKKAHTVI